METERAIKQVCAAGNAVLAASDKAQRAMAAAINWALARIHREQPTDTQRAPWQLWCRACAETFYRERLGTPPNTDCPICGNACTGETMDDPDVCASVWCGRSPVTLRNGRPLCQQCADGDQCYEGSECDPEQEEAEEDDD